MTTAADITREIAENRAKKELHWAKWCIAQGKPVVPLYRVKSDES